MRLLGKTILVTGGSDGIGKQLARQLKTAGATVIVHGRNPERLGAMAGEGFATIEADLSTPLGVDALLTGLGDRALDVLINNAGAGADHDFREGQPDLAETSRTIHLNLTAPIHLITRLMPMLRTRPRALIVNVTSGLAIAPRAGGPVYCATKAALRSYTQAVRHQLKDTNIRLLEALPPVVDTQLTAGRGGTNKLSPEACARQIITAMERDADEANVGLVKLLQLVNSISPALARRIMLKF